MTIASVTEGQTIDPDWGNAVADKLNNADTVGTWTPSIDATTTAPTMGTGSVQLGYYVVTGGLCTMWQFHLFGSSGANQGTGVYLFEFPPGITVASGFRSSTTAMNGMLIGHGGIRDDSSVSSPQSDLPLFVQSAGGGLIRMMTTGLSQVGAGVPITFTNNDIINFYAQFPVDV
jgi:hypothetical protein